MANGDRYGADAHPDMQAFRDDLLAVFKKHNAIIVPSYESEVSFHDPLYIVPLDTSALKFFELTSFDPDDFNLAVE